MMAIRWDALNRTWRSGAKELSHAQKVTLRDEMAAQYSEYIRVETGLFEQGKLEYASWRRNVLDYVMKATGNGYTFGRGGIDQMTDADYDRLARLLQGQSKYFDDLAEKVLSGDVRGGTLMRRAMAYGSSVVQAYEQGQQGAAIGNDAEADWELPFYPGDGESQCLWRCRCAWEILEDEYGWTCIYHTMSDEMVCETCQSRENRHGPSNPLTFDKPGVTRPPAEVAA